MCRRKHFRYHQKIAEHYRISYVITFAAKFRIRNPLYVWALHFYRVDLSLPSRSWQEVQWYVIYTPRPRDQWSSNGDFSIRIPIFNKRILTSTHTVKRDWCAIISSSLLFCFLWVKELRIRRSAAAEAPIHTGRESISSIHGVILVTRYLAGSDETSKVLSESCCPEGSSQRKSYVVLVGSKTCTRCRL